MYEQGLVRASLPEPVVFVAARNNRLLSVLSIALSSLFTPSLEGLRLNQVDPPVLPPLRTMYDSGEVLFLTSGSLDSDAAPKLQPALFEGFLRARGPRSLSGLPLPSTADMSRLVYRVRIVHAYRPFTMSVVCRVRITDIFHGPAAAAPFIPLPGETDATSEGDCGAGEEGDSKDSSPEYILKLYDRRCFVNMRNECKSGPYSKTSAKAYAAYLQGEPATNFTRFFWKMPGMFPDDESDECNLGLLEAWLENEAQMSWDHELAAYDTLRDLQGHAIPFCYDSVVTSSVYEFPADTSPTDDAVGEPESLIDRQTVKGILIEYVPGMSLRRFLDAILRSSSLSKEEVIQHIADIGDEAVALILRIGRYPLLNRDVRIDNVLVRQRYISALRLDRSPDSATADRPIGTLESGDSEQSQASSMHNTSPTELAVSPFKQPRCVAIDFGQSRLRFPDETDEQWRCAKMATDEEGEIGSFYRGWFLKTAKDLRESRGPSGCFHDYEEEELWKFKRTNPWWRQLTPEEQEANIMQSGWGQHPDSWK